MNRTEQQVRLIRLESYLVNDPNNVAILADAMDAATQCSELDRAEFHLQHALHLEPASLTLGLAEVDFAFVKQDWPAAEAVLSRLQTIPETPKAFRIALTCNAAYLAFVRADYPQVIALLKPIADDENELISAPTQDIWLRSLHQTSELEKACAWVEYYDVRTALTGSAAGIASLIAIDHTNLPLAKRWLQASQSKCTPKTLPIEAWITAATLALADIDAAKAKGYADQALKLRSDDGRSWSVRAFAEMLDKDLLSAQASFDRAVTAMPQHIGTWHGRGWNALLLHNFPKARHSFETALGIDPNFSESHGALAVNSALTGQTDDAQASIERALRLDRSCMSAQYAQAVLRGEASDPAKVQSLVRQLLTGKNTGLPAR